MKTLTEIDHEFLNLEAYPDMFVVSRSWLLAISARLSPRELGLRAKVRHALEQALLAQAQKMYEALKYGPISEKDKWINPDVLDAYTDAVMGVLP